MEWCSGVNKLLPTGKKHLSYSEYRDFIECPFRHFNKYVLSKDRDENEYSVFGKAVHTTCEKVVLEENIDYSECFLEQFNVSPRS